MEQYERDIKAAWRQACQRLAAIRRAQPQGEGTMYSFDMENREVREEVDKILRQTAAATEVAVVAGIEAEWDKANAESDALVTAALGNDLARQAQALGYMQRNADAMQAFISRKEAGMALSDRVWQAVQQLREQLEATLTVAIAEGADAQDISRRVRKYLNDPDLMFRRFRYKDEDGHWQRKWKKRVRDEQGRVRFIDYDRDAYRTGPGVYKSAYKNAMRLARTETNIAYHTADHTRWQQLDFVIGYDVVLTNNPGHVEDICDELAGRYPKTFKFVGWHPHCRCRALPVLKSEQDMQADTERIMQGKRPKPAEPLPTPECFTKWVEANAERISNATTLPYFVRDNRDLFGSVLNIL